MEEARLDVLGFQMTIAELMDHARSDAKTLAADKNVKKLDELLETFRFTNEDLYDLLTHVLITDWHDDTEAILHLVIKYVQGSTTSFFNETSPGDHRLLTYCKDTRHIDALVNLGASVNWCDAYGTSILMSLAGKKEHTACLLRHGANIGMRDDDDLDALYYAIEHIHVSGLEVVKMLVEAGADLGPSPVTGMTPLIAMCTEQPRCIEGIEYLVQKGCSVDHVSRDGYTALKSLARWSQGYKAMDKFIKFAKPCLDLVPSDGFSALMVAAKYGNTNGVVLLTRTYGVDVNLRNLNGQTALDIAAESQNSNLTVVTQLVNAGCLFHPELCANPQQMFIHYLRKYPMHYLDALHNKLGSDLAQLVIDKVLPTNIRRKIDLEYGRDLPVEDVFRLPYDRVPDGLAATVAHWKNHADFYNIGKLGSLSRLHTMCQAIAKASHLCNDANNIANGYAEEYERRVSKKHKN